MLKLYMLRRAGTITWLAATCITLVPAVGRAQTMPDCADAMIIETTKLQYLVLDTDGGRSPNIKELTDIRETALGPPPRSANQYATDKVFISETRYCEGRAVLEGGGDDIVYWTIHHFKEDGVDSFRSSTCSAKHDSWGDGCAQWRPAK